MRLAGGQPVSVAMALAEKLHHSAQRLKARAGEEEHDDQNNAPRRQRPPPPQAFFQLFDEEDVERETRPGSVTDPQLQERVQRHTVEHIVDACPFVQILDALVPQMENQLVEVSWHLDLPIPEQVIAVPKISSSSRRSHRRRVPLVQQTAEQLVEVRESVQFAFLLQQQIVDAPILQAGR